MKLDGKAIILCISMIAYTQHDAFAFFSVNAPDSRRTPTGVLAKSGVFQTAPGVLGGKIMSEHFEGFGRKEQLQDAIRGILGRSWATSWGGIDPRQPVTWRSAGTRGETFNRLGRKYRMVIDIDWSHKKVAIYKPGYKGEMLNLDAGMRQRVFRTRTALSLKENIIQWGKMAHWNVEWESKWNDPIHVSSEFGTDFVGAVKNIIRASNRSGGSHFVVDIYSNRVLIVRDR